MGLSDKRSITTAAGDAGPAGAANLEVAAARRDAVRAQSGQSRMSALSTSKK